MAMDQQLSIKVPAGLLARIDQVLEAPDSEWSSRSDFVKAAIRSYLETHCGPGLPSPEETISEHI